MTIIRSNSISGINSITAAPGANLQFFDSTGASLSLDTGNVSAGVITATTLRVTGDLTVEGTTTTLDTVVTEVDKLEVSANNSTVGVAITQSGSGDVLRLYDSGTQVVTVKDGGNVGIGTDNPDEELTVVGTVKVVGSSDPSVRVSSTDTAYNGSMRLNTTNNTLEFFTRYGGTYYTNNLVLKQGNVGIGTDNPNGVKLHLQDSGSPGIRLVRDNAADYAFNLAANGSFYIYDDTADAHRIQLHSDGKIAFGNYTPTYDLDLLRTTSGVGATMRVGSTAASGVNNASVIINNGGTGDAALDFKYESAATPRASIYVYRSDQELRFDTAGSERLRITSTGAIGIGSDFTAIETTGGGGITLDSGVGGGQIGIFLKSTGYTGNQTKLWQDSANAVSYVESTERPLILNVASAQPYTATGSYYRVDVNGVTRHKIYHDGSQYTRQRYSADDSYVKRSWLHFQSAFNNPTVNLCTITGGTANSAVVIYVRVCQIEYYGSTTNTGIFSEGMASIRRESTTYSTYVGSMSVIRNASSGNVGTLSWNGQTLQYTPNRVANYDAYYVEFEAFDSLASSFTITPSW